MGFPVIYCDGCGREIWDCGWRILLPGFLYILYQAINACSFLCVVIQSHFQRTPRKLGCYGHLGWIVRMASVGHWIVAYFCAGARLPDHNGWPSQDVISVHRTGSSDVRFDLHGLLLRRCTFAQFHHIVSRLEGLQLLNCAKQCRSIRPYL